MSLVISPTIRDKLAMKHQVCAQEVEQCFANRNGEYLEETRKAHQTCPITQFFIAETFYGRKLKVVFVFEHGNIYVKTAYEPSAGEIRYYLENGGRVI